MASGQEPDGCLADALACIQDAVEEIFTQLCDAQLATCELSALGETCVSIAEECAVNSRFPLFDVRP